MAHHGLEKLDESGDLGHAEYCYHTANEHLLNAYRRKVPARSVVALATPLIRPGRRPGPLIERLVAAVDELQAAGLTPKDARTVAVKADPDLKREFGVKQDGTLKKAIERARKSSGTK